MSKLVISKAVFPKDLNARGTLYGGKLLDWMDELAGIVAARFSKGDAATVAIEKMEFLSPIRGGTFLDIEGDVVKVGTTSMEVLVEVWMDCFGNEKSLVAKAKFIYVALDENHRPRKF
ncbi:MAG TPA: acyl-CoA thioesterase [Lachnospiraceae bacterium]